MTIDRRQFIKIMWLILLFLFLSIVDLNMLNVSLACAITIITVVFVLLITYDSNNPFNVFYIFLCALALFHFSQVVLYVFNLPVNTSYGYDLFNIYDSGEIFRALSSCLKNYIFIAIGGLCFQTKTNSSNDIYSFDGEEVYRFGILMFWILLLPLIYYDLTLLRSAIVLGYRAKTTYSSTLLTAIDSYFPFAIICILSGNLNDKKWKSYYGFALIRVALQMLLVGNRGPLMICIIMYELARLAFRKQTEKQRGIPFAVKVFLGIIGCIGLSYIAVIRGGHRVSMVAFLREYNAVSLFLSEFGSTLITPILANKYVQSVGILFGKTYIGALAVLLPLSTHYMGNLRSFGNVAAILNPISPMAGALGGSYFADLMINFDNIIPQLMIAFVTGALVIKISDKVNDKRQRIIVKCLMIFISYGVVWYSRGTAQELVLSMKRVVYVAIVYYIYQSLRNRSTIR